jgi:hypothetical protein
MRRPQILLHRRFRSNDRRFALPRIIPNELIIWIIR